MIGAAHPDRIRTNAAARAGDVLVLGKPLGVGIYSAAYKKGRLGEAAYRELIDTTTQLNLPGVELAALDGVHAMTDVTGFGLLGHLLEICRASGVEACVDAAQVPLLAEAAMLAESGLATGASARNWQAYGDRVEFSPQQAALRRTLFTDPQTSGGLLVACAADAVDAVTGVFARAGFAQARRIGALADGAPNVRVA